MTTIKLKPEDTYTSKNGYVQWKIGGKWQAAHRFVMEHKLGRILLPGERVKFVDGNKENLDESNLELTQANDSVQDRIEYLRKVVEVAQAELKTLEEE